jgi:AraC family transcriptional regulator of adaptative response/methylated-DNA-[protein]-cysteine methyltransferase
MNRAHTTRVVEKPTSARTAPSDDARWAAVVARDRASDGTFYTAVVTTGIYCRPSCPARRPKRENVRFYATCADAEAAGFRPCKRCKPRQASGHEHAKGVAHACRLIEQASEPPKLEELAEAVGLSPYHFHRVFKAITGVTPKAYATAYRQQRVRSSLQRSKSVTEAIYDAGFNSSGRFYADAARTLGMTPTAYRNGGVNAAIRFAVGKCSLGHVLVAASDRGVAAIMLGDKPDVLVRELQDRFPRADLIGGDRAFAALVAKVVAFVEAPSASLELPLDIRGTAFQQRVWAALRTIPPGSTATYSEIARRIGKPQSARAVGAACGANPIAVAIPCHRVVGSGGALTGYRWGVDVKRKLLEREAKGKAR